MDQIPLSQERPFSSSAQGLGDEIHFTCQFFPNFLMNWKTYPFVTFLLITFNLVREVIFVFPSLALLAGVSLDIERGAVQGAAEWDHLFVRTPASTHITFSSILNVLREIQDLPSYNPVR